MSKPLNLIQKFKLFRLYLKHQQNGVVIDCALCGSTNIDFEKQESNDVVTPKIKPKEINYSTLYHSEYTCKDCGSMCNNRQEWFRK